MVGGFSGGQARLMRKKACPDWVLGSKSKRESFCCLSLSFIGIHQVKWLDISLNLKFKFLKIFLLDLTCGRFRNAFKISERITQL